jgi:hypothetical protein
MQTLGLDLPRHITRQVRRKRCLHWSMVHRLILVAEIVAQLLTMGTMSEVESATQATLIALIVICSTKGS